MTNQFSFTQLHKKMIRRLVGYELKPADENKLIEWTIKITVQAFLTVQAMIHGF